MRISDWSSDVCSSDLALRSRLRPSAESRSNGTRTSPKNSFTLYLPVPPLKLPTFHRDASDSSSAVDEKDSLRYSKPAAIDRFIDLLGRESEIGRAHV